MRASEIGYWITGIACPTLFGGCLSMRVEHNPRAATILFIAGALSLLPMAFWWSVNTTEDPYVRIAISALVGAFSGACLLIAATETGRTLIGGAQAETSPSISNPEPSPIPVPQEFKQGHGNQYNAPGGKIEINPPPIMAPRQERDPDGIYQLNQKVGI